MEMTIKHEVTKVEKVERNYNVRLVKADRGIEVMIQVDDGIDWYVARLCENDRGLLTMQTFSGIESGDGIAVGCNGSIEVEEDIE